MHWWLPVGITLKISETSQDALLLDNSFRHCLHKGKVKIRKKYWIEKKRETKIPGRKEAG